MQSNTDLHEIRSKANVNHSRTPETHIELLLKNGVKAGASKRVVQKHAALHGRNLHQYVISTEAQEVHGEKT
jgi:hypothetical protein